MAFYINTLKQNSSQEIARLLEKCVRRHRKPWSEMVFLCIGSDRVTGDCLGPYVGYRLSQHPLPGISIYGTLEHPVHAVNLKNALSHISQAHPYALVVAIDASLGEKKHLGYVTMGNGPLYPGAVHCHLPGRYHRSGNPWEFSREIYIIPHQLRQLNSYKLRE